MGVEIYGGAGLGAGAGLSVALVRARVRRWCGRGCGVDAARRWPTVEGSGDGPGDRGLEVRARARRLRSWVLVGGWGSEITRGLEPDGCGSCVGLSGLVWVFCRLIGPSAQGAFGKGFRKGFWCGVGSLRCFERL